MANPKQKEYYEANKEKIVIRSNQWAKNNPERRKEIARDWVRNNPDKVKKYYDSYRRDTPTKYLYCLAKGRAKRKGMDFTIEVCDVGDVPTDCPLLGIPIDSYHEEQKYHPSIDRIDSTKGYVKGNVMIISHRANMLKNNATSEELLLLANNLVKFEVSE